MSNLTAPPTAQESWERNQMFQQLEQSVQLEYLDKFIIEVQTNTYKQEHHAISDVAEAGSLALSYKGLKGGHEFSNKESFRGYNCHIRTVVRHFFVPSKPFGSHLKLDHYKITVLILPYIKSNGSIEKSFGLSVLSVYNRAMSRVSEVANTPEFIEKFGGELSDALSDLGLTGNEMMTIKRNVRMIVESHMVDGILDEAKIISDVNEYKYEENISVLQWLERSTVQEDSKDDLGTNMP